MNSGWNKAIAGMVLLCAGAIGSARGEIVERELGTDSDGNAVKGHVFQAGRGFNRRSSVRTSSLPVRRAPRRRPVSRGIDRGYRYCYPSIWYGSFVPVHHSFGIHSIWHAPVCRAHGAAFSVTILR